MAKDMMEGKPQGGVHPESYIGQAVYIVGPVSGYDTGPAPGPGLKTDIPIMCLERQRLKAKDRDGGLGPIGRKCVLGSQERLLVPLN